MKAQITEHLADAAFTDRHAVYQGLWSYNFPTYDSQAGTKYNTQCVRVCVCGGVCYVFICVWWVGVDMTMTMPCIRPYTHVYIYLDDTYYFYAEFKTEAAERQQHDTAEARRVQTGVLTVQKRKCKVLHKFYVNAGKTCLRQWLARLSAATICVPIYVCCPIGQRVSSWSCRRNILRGGCGTCT